MIAFKKMHGLGNDFVVLDKRGAATFPNLTPQFLQKLSDRKTGIGCDQIVLLENPYDGKADVHMRLFNADGGEVEACGNATRCIAGEIMREKNTSHATIETRAGILECDARDHGLISADMGLARLDWRDIPLSQAVDTNFLDLGNFDLPPACGVNIGNPHAVIFAVNSEKVPLHKYGPWIENHRLFPQKTNVEFAHIINPKKIRMRVWERGVGVTQACGTGACAVLVAAVRRNLIPERKAEIVLDGGSLEVEWLKDGHVIMTGPWARSYIGVWDSP